MAITITVEDGTNVTDANSYVSEAEYATFLENHGLTDSRGTEPKKAALINGWDYLNNLENKYSGTRTNSDQEGSYPRSGGTNNGYSLSSSEIPSRIKYAQCQLAYESASRSLYSVNDGKVVTKTKIDVIEKEYGDNTSENPQPIFAKVESYLSPLFSGGGIIQSVRV